MEDKRYKELMTQVGLPNSRSLLSALQAVENETSLYWKAKLDEKDKELNGLKEDINCLAGAIWRLRKYGYLVESEQGMESEEAQQEHWLSILDFYVEKARSIFKPETSTTQPLKD